VQVERRQRVEDERLAQEAMEEEERNTRELNAKILAKEKAAEEEKKAAVATKIAVSTVDLAAQRRQEANRLKVAKRIAKAEKRAKEAAEKRMNGGAPIIEDDEVLLPIDYFSCLVLRAAVCKRGCRSIIEFSLIYFRKQQRQDISLLSRREPRHPRYVSSQDDPKSFYSMPFHCVDGSPKS
jgi:hypothetical protein